MPHFLTRLAFAIAVLMIASALFVGAAAFLCFALFLFLTHAMPLPFAALVTGLALILFALLILLVARGLAPNGRLATQAGATQAGLIEALLGAEIAAYATRSPFATTGIAFLVGLVFGFNPGLRRSLAQLLRGRL
jgi:hypothetical protein